MIPPLALQNMRLNTAEEHIQTWIMRVDECETLDHEVDLTLEGVRRCREANVKRPQVVLEQIQGVN